jgi:hypothetical protein
MASVASRALPNDPLRPPRRSRYRPVKSSGGPNPNSTSGKRRNMSEEASNASRDLGLAAGGARLTEAPPLHLGFTGSRHPNHGQAQYRTLCGLMIRLRPGTRFHHGDCVGWDAYAHHIALDLGFRVHIHPGLGPRHLRAFVGSYSVLAPAKPNLERNAVIVAETGGLIACSSSMTEELRSGTWSTIRLARRAKKPLAIVFPDGTLTYERGFLDWANGLSVPGTTEPQASPGRHP